VKVNFSSRCTLNVHQGLLQLIKILPTGKNVVKSANAAGLQLGSFQHDLLGHHSDSLLVHERWASKSDRGLHRTGNPKENTNQNTPSSHLTLISLDTARPRCSLSTFRKPSSSLHYVYRCLLLYATGYYTPKKTSSCDIYIGVTSRAASEGHHCWVCPDMLASNLEPLRTFASSVSKCSRERTRANTGLHAQGL
jgi:hypothetical protein